MTESISEAQELAHEAQGIMQKHLGDVTLFDELDLKGLLSPLHATVSDHQNSESTYVGYDKVDERVRSLSVELDRIVYEIDADEIVRVLQTLIQTREKLKAIGYTKKDGYENDGKIIGDTEFYSYREHLIKTFDISELDSELARFVEATGWRKSSDTE